NPPGTIFAAPNPVGPADVAGAGARAGAGAGAEGVADAPGRASPHAAHFTELSRFGVVHLSHFHVLTSLPDPPLSPPFAPHRSFAATSPLPSRSSPLLASPTSSSPSSALNIHFTYHSTNALRRST